MTRVGRKRPHHMGALSSKARKRTPQNWSWTGPPGEHSPYPTDPAPYPGYEVTYCFLDIMAGFKPMDNRLNLGPMAVSTDVDDYLVDLEACYKEGYHLNCYIRVPGVRNTVEVEDWGIKTPYQAILSKALKKTGDVKLDWELHVEKCILSTKTSAFDSLEGENDLLRTIHRNAEKGGRLLCAVPVGYVRSNTPNTQYGVLGMELFFNMPKEKTKTRYTYHAIKIPARYYTSLDATQTIQQIQCDSDFQGQMKLFLNQGWKLVDICLDTMALAEAFRMTSTVRYVDTVWIFEKDQDKLDDTSPRYEGVILEYLHKVKTSTDGEQPVKDWRPVIAGMGVMGWDLAAMIQTPVLVQSGFTTFTIKMMMIFQRKLIPSFEKLRDMKSTKVSDGYPGSSLYGRGPAMFQGGSVFTAKGADEDTTGYYHQTLKKYIYSTDNSISGPIKLSTFSTDDQLSPRLLENRIRNRVRNAVSPQPNRRAFVPHLNGYVPQNNGSQRPPLVRSRSVDSEGLYPPTYSEALNLTTIPVT